MTFVTTTAAILYGGARPVFVDVDPGTWNMDPHLVETAITPRTKATLPVHLHGLTVVMRPLVDIARRHGLAVIEDAGSAAGPRLVQHHDRDNSVLQRDVFHSCGNERIPSAQLYRVGTAADLLHCSVMALGGVAGLFAVRDSGLFARLLQLVRGFSAEAAGLVLRPQPAGTLVVTSGAMHLATMDQFYAIAWGPRAVARSRELPAVIAYRAAACGIAGIRRGLGVREGAVVGALAIVGIAPGDAVTTSILYGTLTPALGVATVTLGLGGEWLAPFARKHLFRSAAEIQHD